jgi:hypothetical protein
MPPSLDIDKESTMGTGREYSSYQRKIINRYYANFDTIVLTRLSEIATDMVLAAGDDKKLDRLWKRAEQALSKAVPKGETPDPEIGRVLESRDIEQFGKLVNKLNR